jgi:hypothetical protein
MEHQDQAIMVRHAIAGRQKVTGQDVCLVDPVIGKETVCGLGIGPILADQWNALPHGASDLRKQFAQPFVQTFIREITASKLFIQP